MNDLLLLEMRWVEVNEIKLCAYRHAKKQWDPKKERISHKAKARAKAETTKLKNQ